MPSKNSPKAKQNQAEVAMKIRRKQTARMQFVCGQCLRDIPAGTRRETIRGMVVCKRCANGIRNERLARTQLKNEASEQQ